MKSTTIAAVVLGVALVGAAVILTQSDSQGSATFVDGAQIVTVTAKGGYSPRLTTAKADTPTMLRIETSGTFDCSSILTIPSMNYEKNLPPSGITEIEIPPQEAGTTVEGICSMGMYGFEIAFE